MIGECCHRHLLRPGLEQTPTSELLSAQVDDGPEGNLKAHQGPGEVRRVLVEEGKHPDTFRRCINSNRASRCWILTLGPPLPTDPVDGQIQSFVA